ncbi:vWA domain-containing protein [Butyrivibrio proteoclasticus]|uniref:vWA domain-containing protein n=1 Tax=Butyrivibrio proteoclasticus TaxID=43305 RepID=UPI00047DD063|nr:hypothetical protein [Butyrivibrio proteoclasticus]
MELMYGIIIVIGIILTAIVSLVFVILGRKKTEAYKNGIKASNTARIKSSQLYKKLVLKYTVCKIILVVTLILSIVGSLVLAARPYKTEEVETGVKKRDIILCLDVSYSLYELNAEITEYLKNVVRGLQGDRFGISIFNTTSVTYVPLTDDYDYVLDRLDELGEYFALQKELYDKYLNKYDYYSEMSDETYEAYLELVEQLDYFDAGTLYNSSTKGSSLVGEGLGTALYTFPYLEDSERTRVIIMCTDNELNAFKKQIMDLDDAAKYCAKNKVTVFGVFPSEEDFYLPEEYDYSSCLKEFKSAVETTGGKFYVRSEDQSVEEIVKDIQKQEAMLVKVVVSKQNKDLPETYFIVLLICLACTCVAGLVLQK